MEESGRLPRERADFGLPVGRDFHRIFYIEIRSVLVSRGACDLC
jgi:hypothetical protein